MERRQFSRFGGNGKMMCSIMNLYLKALLIQFVGTYCMLLIENNRFQARFNYKLTINQKEIETIEL